MVGSSGSSEDKISSLDLGNPLHLQNSDFNSATIISVKLTETENYRVWAAAMKLAISTRNKTGFLYGTCLKFAYTSSASLSNQSNRCNSIVLSWLLNSVSEDLFLGQIFFDNASDVWAELKETYDKLDGYIILSLLQKIHNFKQGELTVSGYYHRLNSLWREFDIMTKLPKCSCAARDDVSKHHQLMRLMQFLMGLNDVYQPIRSSLLSRETLPDVKEAFAIISREESHRGIASSSGSVPKPQISNFVSRTIFSNNNNNGNKIIPTSGNNTFNTNINNRGPNLNLTCKNYGKVGHTIERCFDIIGYPPRYNRNSSRPGVKSTFTVNADVNQTNQTSTYSSPSLSLFNEQIMNLMSLINDMPSGSAQANMAGRASFLNHNVFFNINFHKFFNSNTVLVNISIGWIIDSGANQHMTVTTKNMFGVVDISDLNLTVGHPNGTLAKIKYVGNLQLSKDVVLYDVLVVPEYCVSLLSVNKLIRDSRLFVGFDESKCYIQDLIQNKIVGTGSESGGLYHTRLGHPADQVLSVLHKDLQMSKGSHVSLCDTCHKAKQTRKPFPLSEHKTSNVGDLIHLDLWRPYKVTSREGFRYFLTVVDDFSRGVWLYLLKTKDEVCNMFKSFHSLLLTQFNCKIKNVRSDNGTEFVNNNMDMFFNHNGIIHQTTCPYTPQQNGIVERKHRHLLNVARSLMFQGWIPLYMWTECVLTAVYLINRLPSSLLNGNSPFKMIYGIKPKLSHIRSFGCLCYSTVLNNSDKFSSMSVKCVLIGFSTVKKAYKLYSLDDKTVFYARDVKFYENVFPFKMNSKLSCVFDSKLSKEKFLNQLNLFDSFDIQNSKSPYDEERATFNDEGSALNNPNSPISVSDGGTTTSMGDKSISTGNSYNTQSVLFFQDPTNAGLNIPITDVSFENTDEKYGLEKVMNYSKLSSGNYCFSTSLNKSTEPSTFYEAIKDRNWIDAMNAEIEALNRNNTWTITTLPKGRKAIGSKWVYKIKYKATGNIDRHKARQWNAKLVSALTDNGFVQSKYDYSLFVKGSGDTFVALLVYVDDIVITGSDIKQIYDFKQYLKILHEFGLLATKPVLSLVPANFVLNHIESNEDKALTNVSNYQKLIEFSDILKVHLVVVSRSSTEAEYRCMASATCEIIWICNVLSEFGIKNMFPVEMFCDNISALQLAANHVFHEKSKHFEIDLYLIREKVSEGVIKTFKVHTTQQIADIFTKVLDVKQHQELCNKLNLKDMVVLPLRTDEGSLLIRVVLQGCFVEYVWESKDYSGCLKLGYIYR
ncbi:putative RNA-directed DNA polymerase [Tanacetum coccineum]|uniref:RNA-directed DNA polymerase n=1 Tax=Tanacetum coccineum TaxID=301880 RepID=A0ABQ5DHA3_9ASTR